MTKKERFEGILAWFGENMPVAETELHYRSPYELLVAVMLSAQCTDKRVNIVTPALFAALPTVEAMAQGDTRSYQKHQLPQQQSRAPKQNGTESGANVWRLHPRYS